MTDYLALVSDPTRGDHERFADVKQPVYVRDNVYALGAPAYEGELSPSRLVGEVVAEVVEDGEGGDQVFLETRLPAAFDDIRLTVVGGADLPRVRFVDAEFEEPDGTPAVLTTDLVGTDKDVTRDYPAGPIAQLSSGVSRIRVW